MLMRSFTKREKFLLLVLVFVLLAGLYVLGVHNPVKANLARLEGEKEEAELRLEVAQLKLGQYHEMKAELEEIFAQPADQLTVMPPYDNTKALMVQFNHIFGELEYDLSFSQATFNDNVATRAVQFTFDAPSYEEARIIIERLNRTGNRSLMNTLSIAPSNNGTGGDGGIFTIHIGKGGNQQRSIREGPQTVSGTITFYELAEGNAAKSEG